MEQKSSYVLRLAGITLGLALLVWLAVLVVGLFYQWNTPVQFSNGFFVADTIVIVLAVFSVAGGFGQRASFPLTYAESVGSASLPERAQLMMADVNQRYGMMILLVGAGLLLIGISILIYRLF